MLDKSPRYANRKLYTQAGPIPLSATRLPEYRLVEPPTLAARLVFAAEILLAAALGAATLWLFFSLFLLIGG